MGPYTVVAQMSEVNYRIKDQATGREQTVHANRMKLLPAKVDPEKISEEQFRELFGDSDEEDEELYGFEVEDSAEAEYAGIVNSSYTTYEVEIQE